MKYLSIFICLFISVLNGFGQYYYNDIIVTQQVNNQYALLKKNNIKNVSAVSLESDNQPAENFSVVQYLSDGTMVTETEHPSTGKSISVNTYTSGRITKSADSSSSVSNTTLYTYDTDGRLQTITTLTDDAFMNSHSEEVHQWHYAGEQPDYMLRIKDKTDTTTIQFIKDEAGDIAEEHWQKSERTIEKYFYYYDSSHRLTDIVRYNLKARRMLPDFLFEYDEEGRLSRLTQVPQGSSNYLIWQYSYNENGLKEKEFCFNKQKQLIGRIEYVYK